MNGNNKKRQKSKPQKRELVGDREDARGHFWISFPLTRITRDSPARSGPRAARTVRQAKESIRAARRARFARCVASGKTAWEARCAPPPGPAPAGGNRQTNSDRCRAA